MLQPFVWGDRGEQLTPEQVDRLRQSNAAAAARGSDTSPVGHWTQGLARLVDAFGAYRGGVRANQVEQAGQDRFQNWQGRLGSAMGGSPVVDALAGADDITNSLLPTPADQPSSPQFAPDGSIIRQGLVSRGLPEHVADAFVMNFQDESGLNPGINEAEPIVPGSRGGFGLAQWTGPRRRQLEEFAAQRGTPVSDLDTQLDFLMAELQGPESRAAQSILSAQDTGSAAAAIVNNFLRPAEEHRARREASYLGGASPMSAGAQAGGMSPDVVSLLMEGMSDPWIRQQGGPVIEALMGQHMQQSDPMYQAQLQHQQLQNQALMNPARPDPVYQGGQWWDISSGQPQALTDAAADQTSAMQNYEYLVSQGMDPQAAMDRVFSGGVNVNVGGEGQRMGSIPAGMAAVEDPTNPSGFRLEAIPGGPAALEMEAAQAAREGQQVLTSRQLNPTIDDITTARDLAENGIGTTGMFSGMIGRFPGLGQDSVDMAATIDAIGSGISLENLNQMRQNSPTGGALGNVSDKQSALLSEAFGSLRQSMSKDQFLYNLARVENTLNDIVHGEGNGPQRHNMERLRQQLRGGRSSAGQQAAPAQQPAAAQAQGGLTIGQTEGGYRYIGGNPSDPSSWEQVR